MILSHKYKFIFIHIGKTGGTSISRALCQLIGMDMEETRYNSEVIKLTDKSDQKLAVDYRGKFNCKHIYACDLKEIIGDDIWDEYYKFTFIRNPYDRLLSLYSMFTQYDAFKNCPWNDYPSFQDLLNSIVAGDTTIEDNPYYHFLTDENGELLVDYVGKFESLQDNFDTICATLGLQQTLLPHVTSSVHSPYQQCYTPEAVEMVHNINSKDFKLFEYPRKIPGIKQANIFQKIRIHLQQKKTYPAL